MFYSSCDESLAFIKRVYNIIKGDRADKFGAGVVCLSDSQEVSVYNAGKLFAETNRMFFFTREQSNDRSTKSLVTLLAEQSQPEASPIGRSLRSMSLEQQANNGQKKNCC